jgi:hypothetical protein
MFSTGPMLRGSPWIFGVVAPVRTIKPGTVLKVWTEDAFGGKVRGPDDLVSRVGE